MISCSSRYTDITKRKSSHYCSTNINNISNNNISNSNISNNNISNSNINNISNST